MHDWLQEEEIDVEAMIEAIASLQNLYENSEKLSQKINSLETDLKALKSGRKSIKSMFSFKSKDEDLKIIEGEKMNFEKSLQDLEGVVKLATYNIDSYIEYFKVEKLAGYYHNLKLFAELQKANSLKINELWECVGQDKNVRALDSEVYNN